MTIERRSGVLDSSTMNKLTPAERDVWTRVYSQVYGTTADTVSCEMFVSTYSAERAASRATEAVLAMRKLATDARIDDRIRAMLGELTAETP